jgi:hypothetical protein
VHDSRLSFKRRQETKNINRQKVEKNHVFDDQKLLPFVEAASCRFVYMMDGRTDTQ